MVEGPQKITEKATPDHAMPEKPSKPKTRRSATEAWSDWVCHISEQDAEGGLPLVQNSGASAASFAFVEQLGVRPPSAVGWARQEAKDSEGWLNSVPASEWIYHVADEVYFHLPSSTLWKRIEVDCRDPDVAAHTFRRVDAVHLQALALFAQSMDSALLPCVWAAWVQHTKRRRARAGSSAAAVSAADCKQTGDADRAHQVSTEEPRKPEDATFLTSDAMASEATGMADISSQEDAKDFPIGCKEEAGPSESPDKGDDMALVVMAESEEIPESPLPRSSWLCLRSRRKGKSERGCRNDSSIISTASTQDSSIKPTAPQASRMSSPTFRRRKSGSSITDEAGSPGWGFGEVSRPHIAIARSSAARHERTFEQFLSEVKRRPERLIAHIDKRRAEKTQLAYVVVT